MILRLDGIKYDIYEGKNHTSDIRGEVTLAPRCFKNFKSNGNIGYADVLYYELSVLSGLKHNINDYKYKDKIYIAVVETYKDSNSKTYKVQKKINVGAYIRTKGQAFTMTHLTHGNAGQLVSIDGVVFNNSDFAIKIKDLKIYKSMTYANAGVGGDNTEVIPEVQAGTHVDTVGGERTEPFKVWGSLAYTYSHMPTYEYLYKEGNTEWWSTLDYWTLNLKALMWNANGTVSGEQLVNEIYTDKFQLCSLNDDGTFNIPAYTEYLYIKSKDSKGYGYVHIIYLNSLGLYYGGTDTKYHRSIIDGEKTGRVYYSADKTIKYTQYFESDATHNELGEIQYPYEPIEGNWNKYEDKNFDGVCTLQLKVVSNLDSIEDEYYNILFSTQPFRMMQMANDKKENAQRLASAVPVYLGNKVGEEYLFWVLPKYVDSVVGKVMVRSTTLENFMSGSQQPADVAKRYFANDMRALDKFENAIEDR